jgi:hypothetical protein
MTKFWDSKKKPMTRNQVVDKMTEAVDVAIALAQDAGVPAHAISDFLESRVESLRQQDAIMKPIGH